jgi:type IV pilus assembly protein PilE
MHRGFSLIELVIVLAVVAILAAVALPAYTAQMRRSVRADALSFLTDAANRQQQYLVDRRTYATSFTALGVTPPATLSGKYTFTATVVNGPPPTFSLAAAATSDQVKDACPALSIDNAGNRTPATCW